MASSFIQALALAILATASARAGTLDHGNWSPSGCGAEPTQPAGVNLSSADAYNESMKWIKTYQEEYSKFADCMVKEADEDNAGINDHVRASQDKAQAFFDKVNADSKRAQSVLSGGSNAGGRSWRNGSGPGAGGGSQP
jgi:hypothetical protein